MNDCYQIDPGYIRYMLHSVSNNEPSKDCFYSIWDDLTPAAWVFKRAWGSLIGCGSLSFIADSLQVRNRLTDKMNL